ncbi:hypothetical protein DUG22_16610 [Salmonella enterica]|nr:hypothetical protein [Salmonella enterica]EDI2542571.1 hypothetical protein [Salmonella enterica subsp. enterica serovar Enteritidis]
MIKISPPCLMKFYVFSLHLQKIIKNTLLLLVCILPFFCDAKMLFFRIPFRIQTYTPITRGGIKRLAVKGWVQELLQRNHGKVLALLSPHGNKCYLFDDENIRIYIYEDNHEYFIDNKGVVLFKNKKNYKCSKNKINENEIVMLLNDGNVDTWEKDE